jgi:6-phosphofructokinase 1
MYKQIGVITGGGDAPGLNAVIRAIVRTAIGEFGMKVVGIENSFEGLIGEIQTMKLTPKAGRRNSTARRNDFGNEKHGQFL